MRVVLQSSDTFELTVTANGLVPFADPVIYPGLIATRSQDLAIADLNGDGQQDIISTTRGFSGRLVVLMGQGDATIGPEIPLNQGSSLFAGFIFASDYDADGDIDIMAFEYTNVGDATTAGEVAVYINDGNANFTRQTILSGVTRNLPQFRAADLNGDGRADFIRMADPTTLVYHESLPGGGYAAQQIISSSATLTTVRFDDVDNDGDLDILGYSATSPLRTLVIFPNDGAGNFGTPQQLTFAAVTTIQGMTDLTGDGLPDLLAIDSSRAVYYAQNPDGTFGERTELPFTPVTRVNPADLNADGVTDLVLYNGTSFSWAVGRGNGTFGATQLLMTSGFANTLTANDLDGDGDLDIVIGSNNSGLPLIVIKNRSGENPMQLIPPASRTYLGGDQINLQVKFGFPIVVTGTPRIALQLGENTVYADYISGSGTSTLLFRYTVAATDIDLDGVQLVTNVVDLNGGTLTDPEGGAAVLQFPAMTLSGVVVNAPGPLVQMISRMDDRATEAATVRFQLQFAEPVTGVDVDDLAVVMNAGDLAGAAITGVTGSGSLYEVTVSTGTGSGTLGLSVKRTASIFDLNGDILGKAFTGGEVYTVRREAIGDIDVFYTHAHSDYRPTLIDGEISWLLRSDAGLLPNNLHPSEEVYTYLDSTAIVSRPTGINYDFLGVPSGAPLYLSNSSGNIASVPFLGFSGESIPTGTFASYLPVDSRITATPQGYIKVEMVGMRSSSGGEFSIYSIASGNPRVWMASSDGISSTDNIWTRSGNHAHYNTAFSKPGIYEVDVVVSGYLDSNGNGTYDPIIDPYIESGIKTMVFNIDTLRAVNDSFMGVEGITLNGNVSLNDDWHESMGAYTASVETAPANGTLSLQANGSFTYEPDAGFAGPDSFVYRLTNERGGFTMATASITVVANHLVPFAIPTSHSGVVAQRSNTLVSADFNGDGIIDLVNGAGVPGSLALLLGNGDSSFQAESAVNPGSPFYVGTLFATDYDDDGDVDLLTGEYDLPTIQGTASNGAVAVHLNDGTGNFTRQSVLGGRSFLAARIQAGDLNGDGRLDLISMESSSTLAYRQALPGGGFGASQTVSSAFTGLGTIRFDDVDGDGDLDILGYEATPRKLSIFVNDGTASFSAPTSLTFSTSTTVQAMVDITGDSRPDLLAVETTGSRQAVYYPQNADGSFGARTVLPFGNQIFRLFAGDVNQDGVTDLLSSQQVGTVFDLRWSSGQGNGGFSSPQLLKGGFGSITNVIVRDLDSDGDPEITAGHLLLAAPVTVFENLTGENPMLLIPPASRGYLGGERIEMQVHFGFPINVTGVPRIALQMGANTVHAEYVSGSGTPTLLFRYTVSPADLDLDGVQLVSNVIDLNGGSLTDPNGGAGVLQFPNVTFSNVFVNGSGPFVEMINRLDTTPTEASTVRFSVQFTDAVTGVDASDFAVVSNAGDLTGATIQSVTGSGNLYEVTVTTGTGSGTLGLRVLTDSTIVNSGGFPLAREYFGGQVYTLRRSAASPIDVFYTTGHADYRPILNNREVTFVLHSNTDNVPGGQVESDEAYTYVDSTALLNRPSSPTYDFTGAIAGTPFYVIPPTQVPTIPFLGFNAESIPSGVFASYRPDDARITSSASLPYLKWQMAGLRSSSDGEFAVWSATTGDPQVWMASSDGLTSTDNIWLQAGSHSHYNIGFSKSGIYEVDVFISGFLDVNADGVYQQVKDTYFESGIFTMVFNIDTLGARNDAFNVNGKETLSGSVTLNDQWDDGIGAYAASVQTTTTKGTLSLQPNGSFTYQPSATFDGSDSFTYRLANPRGGFTTATVTITGSTRPDFVSVQKTGHADIGVNFEDGDWDLHIHDHEPDTEYEPDEAMIYVGRDAMQTRSGDSANATYDFLGAPVGSTLFVLPEVENTNLLFLGIGGEELADGLLDGDIATLRLASVSGPGQFSMWQAGLTATTPKLLMATSDGIDASDAFDVGAGSHAHANFAFTKQGLYEVTFVASGVDADGNATDSGQVTYYFYVTDGLVPFAMPNFLDPNITSASAPQLVDLNGDGKLDLAIAGAGGVGYILGVGDGSFSPVQYLPGSIGARNDLVAIDFDGDGDVDLLNLQANATDTADILSLYRNDGTANFTRVELITSLPRFSSQVEAADLNGDGRLDVVYGRGNTGVAYAMQQANGTLGSEVILPVTLTTASAQVTDLDADGDHDIVVGNRTGANNGAITVFKNSGSGVFTAAQTISTGNFPSVLKLTDMNGDGRMDIVSTQLVANTRAGYFPQLADGTFGPRVNVMTAITQLNSIEVADINEDGVPDIVAGVIMNGIFVSAWSAGLGGGAYANPILLDPNQSNSTGMRVADLDGDSHPDIIATGNADTLRPSGVRVLINKTGEDPMVLVPPVSRLHVAGDVIDLSVYFGFPVTVTGTPRIAFQLGASTVYANYLSGSGTGTLKFRYAVTTSDVDFDGVQLASNVIDLNDGTIKDPLNGNAVLTFPNLTFDGVIVNGAGPLVQGISRLDSRATEAAIVRFQIQFAEPVTGVDIDDLAVVMNAGDLAGASIVSVSGSGSLFEVTVSTGTGSGTLGLSVKGTASIFDLNGDILGKGFTGGQVYTVRRQAIGDIDTFYTNAHSDYRPTLDNGEFSWILRADAGLLPNSTYPSEDVYTHLDSTAIVSRPTGANYDFLGVPSGAPLYLSNSAGNIASVPFLGFSGESVSSSTIASYYPGDTRLSTTPQSYMKVEMVGMRSSSGGDFSIYSIASGNPRVWMPSSDGLTSTDNIWIRTGSHTHYNTAFSKPGIYEVDVVVSAYIDSNGNGTYDPIIDQYIESGIKTMVFHIDTLGAVNDAVTIYGLRPVHGNVTLNDDWHDELGAYALSLVTTTSKGTLTLQPNGAYTYVPSASFAGTDSFVYRLTNERGGITTGTVTITGAVLPDFEAILMEGHADIGVALGAHEDEGGDGDGGHEDPEWDLHVHDGENDIEYRPGDALLYIGMDAITARPADAAYNFTGVAAGESLFVLPPVNTPTLLFLGFGTEEIADGTLQGGSLTLRLKSASGPGHFSIWSSTVGGPNVAMATFDGITEADLLTLLENGHAHFNLGFTEMGMYQITFQAIGTLADGDVIVSEDVTYYFKVGNTAEAIDVQNGMTQRSYIRNLDVLFGSDDGLDDILANPGRVQITKYDLNGNNGSVLPATAFGLSTSGSSLKFDFGLQGLGGNRNTNAGDGYYRVGIDADGDGEFETFKSFYRLLGDVNGDHKVDASDRTSVMAALRSQNPEADANGDGVVNSADLTLVTRAIGRKFKDDLFADD
jgi:surface-anchored protein